MAKVDILRVAYLYILVLHMYSMGQSELLVPIRCALKVGRKRARGGRGEKGEREVGSERQSANLAVKFISSNYSRMG